MISFFQRTIKGFLGISSLERNLELLKENQKESLSFTILDRLFRFERIIPITSWSLSPSKILFLINEILLNNRKKIIEFGSGFSTYVIAKLIQKNNLDIVFYSIESDMRYYELVKEMLIEEELLRHVELLFAPLGDSSMAYKSEMTTWYSKDKLETLDLKDIDLIIVDGPVGGSKYIRYHAVPFLKKSISENFCIFLDDTDRNEEREIIEDWRCLMKVERFISKKNFSVIKSENSLDPSPYFVY